MQRLEDLLTRWHYWLMNHTEHLFVKDEKEGECNNTFLCPNSRHTVDCILSDAARQP